MSDDSSKSLVLRAVREVDADIRVSQIYRDFSGEVLRLAVVSTGGIVLFMRDDNVARIQLQLLMAAAISFSVSSALSLWHRYDSGEAVACLVRYVRLAHRGDTEKAAG